MIRVDNPATRRYLLITLAFCTIGVARAGSPCDLVTEQEASRLLGTPAVKKPLTSGHSKAPACLIQASDGGTDSLRVTVETMSPDNAPRLLQHVDDERGDEIPSMHGDSWYEISVPDDKHPGFRRMVVHRDRTSLILDLQSARQKNAKAAFEKTWYPVSRRLPTDEKE